MRRRQRTRQLPYVSIRTPVKGVIGVGAQRVVALGVSIRTPVKGVMHVMHNTTRFSQVSIRTPVKGVMRARYRRTWPKPGFNPHPREGGDRYRCPG